MGRRPRSHQSNGRCLATILVAGLAFVDSFNLVVHSPQHGRLQSNPCRQQQRHGHVRTASSRSTCPATSRSSIPDGLPSSRRASERKAGTSQQPTPVVTTARTRASASKVAATKISAAAASATNGQERNARGHGSSRRRSKEAGAEESRGAAGRTSRALQQKQRLQRSIGGLDERAMSRGQLVSSLALVGAAAAILGGSGKASAFTEVRLRCGLQRRERKALVTSFLSPKWSRSTWMLLFRESR